MVFYLNGREENMIKQNNFKLLIAPNTDFYCSFIKRLALMLTFFMFIVLPISIGFAENKVFSNKFLNFKITVPNGYQILNSGSSNIPLLIRANNVDFPEFNIVLGNYNSIQKNSAWDKVVKEDYNNVGIPDVEKELKV